MAIERLVAGQKGDPSNSKGEQIRDAVNALIDERNQKDGVWLRLPAIYKLIMTGVGTVVFSTRDIYGNSLQYLTFTVDGYKEEYHFFDGAYEFITAYTGTAKVEVV